MLSTYIQARTYLEEFISAKNYVSVTPGSGNQKDPLGRMRHLLALLDNPHYTFRSIIVSGTSGKGSTTYLTAHILAKAGYKTGFMSSPHLQKINERMQISENGTLRSIADEAFISLLNEMVPHIESMEKCPFGLPTYNEVLAAMSLLHFAKQRVDIAAIEVGLEGKFEATNLLYPLIFVLTNISHDHVAILGNTIAKIADEATYRITLLRAAADTQPLVITGPLQPSVTQLVRQRAVESNAQVLRIQKNFTVSNVVQGAAGVTFDFRNQTTQLPELYVSLLGDYQAMNAALATETVLHLQKSGLPVEEHVIRYALRHAFFPGRFEIRVIDGVEYVIDGAHNPAKMHAFLHSLYLRYPTKKKVFVVAFKKDKDAGKLLRPIKEQAEAIVLTRFISNVDLGKNLGMGVQEVRQHAIQAGFATEQVTYQESVADALTHAQAIAKRINAIVVITGSMYLIGEVGTILG